MSLVERLMIAVTGPTFRQLKLTLFISADSNWDQPSERCIGRALRLPENVEIMFNMFTDAMLTPLAVYVAFSTFTKSSFNV